MRAVVLIASAVERARRRWRRGLEERFAIQEVTRRSALVRSMAELNPGILLLDLELPRLGRVASLRAVQRLSPLTAIVLLTSTPNDDEGIRALKEGARGYFKKNIVPSLLKRAVTRIQEGEIWAGRKIVSSVLDELASVVLRRQKVSFARPRTRVDRLSARQREIAHLVGGGATNKEIATRLDVTERAVKAHLTVIFRKLGLSNRLQLALFMAEHSRVSR